MSYTPHGLGFALNGYDVLVCAHHMGALEFTTRVRGELDRVECPRNDCPTYAFTR